MDPLGLSYASAQNDKMAKGGRLPCAQEKKPRRVGDAGWLTCGRKEEKGAAAWAGFTRAKESKRRKTSWAEKKRKGGPRVRQRFGPATGIEPKTISEILY